MNEVLPEVRIMGAEARLLPELQLLPNILPARPTQVGAAQHLPHEGEAAPPCDSPSLRWLKSCAQMARIFFKSTIYVWCRVRSLGHSRQLNEKSKWK